jgi:hypothetical protein
LPDDQLLDRAAQRTRTLLQARIEFNNGATTVDCTVRDLSETGARLQVPQSAVVPPHFVLFVPKHGRRYQAQLRWHRDGYIGAAFEVHAAGEVSESEREEDGRVAKLEAEIARLRRVIESIRADPSQARLLVERFDLTTVNF